MIPLRLVIDTDVVVSAVLKPEGLQRTVFLLATTRSARWYVSDLIMAEYSSVLARPELKIRKSPSFTGHSVDQKPYLLRYSIAVAASYG